jgi:transcriptional regulator GlxA family with amidase domain
MLTASVCTGAFLLAKAGLLDGLVATTHWEDQAALRAAFPKVSVRSDRPWLDCGKVVTSGGISAGIDMCLHLVERLADRRLAIATAKQMEYKWNEHETAAPADPRLFRAA